VERALLGAALISACSPASIRLPPLTNPEGSVIVAWGADAACASLSAVSLDVPPDNRVELSLGPSADTYWAMISSASLEQLGITSGPLPIEPIDPATCMVPDASFIALTSAGWEPSLSNPIASCVCFPKPPAPTCPIFMSQDIRPPETNNSNFGLQVGPTSVLTSAITSNNLYRIDVGTSTPTVEAIPAPPGLPLQTAIAMDDGSIWVAGNGGRLWHLQPGPPLEVLTTETASPAEDFLRMDGAHSSSAAPDLYLISVQGGWFHFDGQSWKLLHRFTATTDFTHYRGATLRLGPSSALAGKGVDPGIVRLLPDGTVRTELPGARRLEPFSALASIRGLGTLAGSSTGTVYLDRGDGRWRFEAALPRLDYALRSFAPYDGGFALTADAGLLAVYAPSTGLCTFSQIGPAQLNWVVPIGDDLVVGGDVVGNQQLQLEVLRRKH
jgi:hypothetical protein